MPTILFLNKSPPYRHTGAEQIVWAIATHLATSGWDVHFLSPDDSDQPIDTDITLHTVDTPDSFFEEKALYFLKGIPAFRRICDEIEPDIIYDNSSPFPFLYAYIYKPKKVITKVHAIYGWTALRNKDHPVTKVGTLLGEQFYRFFDGSRMLAISESTKQRLQRRVCRNPSEITVVNNGIDHDQFAYKYSPKGPILSLCELTPRKNVGILLRAWAHLESADIADRKLVIAGDGPRRNELRELAAELSLSDVSFKGYVSNEEKHELFRDSFCYVLPTRMEGFGLANLEAMASGCIVVSTDTPGVRDYLRDGHNGKMIPSDEPAALACTLQQLMNNPEDSEELAVNGRKTVEDYDIKETIEIERQILEGFL